MQTGYNGIHGSKTRVMDKIHVIRLDLTPIRDAYNQAAFIYRSKIIRVNDTYRHFQAYIDIGEMLLNYCGIDDTMTHWNEFAEKMYRLGQLVMHITVTYENSGVIGEEVCWLGEWSNEEYAKGINFHPLEHRYFGGLKAWHGSSQPEKDRILSSYLSGKEKYILEKFPYRR